MNILYEISSMGRSLMLGNIRTGVSRVTENIAHELVKRADSSLRFVAYDFQGASDDYLRAEFPGACFAHSAWRPVVSRSLYSRFNPVTSPAEASERCTPISGWKQKSRAVVVESVKRQLRKIDGASLKWAQVYHAPTGEVIPQVTSSDTSIVITIHDVIAVKYPEYFPERIREIAAQFVAGLSKHRWYLCDSDCTRNDLLELQRCDPDKVGVAHLAAEKQFHPRTSEETATVLHKYRIPDEPYILSVCTLEPRKNLAAIVEAFAEFIRSEKSARVNLVLSGAHGWKNDRMNAMLASIPDVRSRIVLTGYVADSDLASLYSGAMGFVYVPFYEGFGLPPLEAMQCGAPVISSDVSSLPEVVGQAALLTQPQDVQQIAAYFQLLHDNGDLREELKNNGLLQAKKFSWERTAEKTRQFYAYALSVDRKK